jgi:hypothetical protein
MHGDGHYDHGCKYISNRSLYTKKSSLVFVIHVSLKYFLILEPHIVEIRAFVASTRNRVIMATLPNDEMARLIGH